MCFELKVELAVTSHVIAAATARSAEAAALNRASCLEQEAAAEQQRKPERFAFRDNFTPT